MIDDFIVDRTVSWMKDKSSFWILVVRHHDDSSFVRDCVERQVFIVVGWAFVRWILAQSGRKDLGQGVLLRRSIPILGLWVLTPLI